MTSPTAALAMAARAIRVGDPAAAHVRAGPIADAADGLHVARRVGVVVELVAQPADVDVDRAVEDLGRLVAVDRVEQLVARQDPTVGGEDRAEEPELDAREVDDVPSPRRTSWRSGSTRQVARGGGRRRRLRMAAADVAGAASAAGST